MAPCQGLFFGEPLCWGLLLEILPLRKVPPRVVLIRALCASCMHAMHACIIYTYWIRDSSNSYRIKVLEQSTNVTMSHIAAWAAPTTLVKWDMKRLFIHLFLEPIVLTRMDGREPTGAIDFALA